VRTSTFARIQMALFKFDLEEWARSPAPPSLTIDELRAVCHPIERSTHVLGLRSAVPKG
jgi:hypothetical protein